MKTFGKYLLWILGIFAWFMLFFMCWMGDITNGTSAHKYILVITGVCLALYIFRKTGAGTKELEHRIQELEKENEKLRQAADQKFVQDSIDKTSGK